MTQHKKLVAEIVTGERTINGTNWPIVDQVIREQAPRDKRPRWIAILGLCNGIPKSAIECETRKMALSLIGVD